MHGIYTPRTLNPTPGECSRFYHVNKSSPGGVKAVSASAFLKTLRLKSSDDM